MEFEEEKMASFEEMRIQLETFAESLLFYGKGRLYQKGGQLHPYAFKQGLRLPGERLFGLLAVVLIVVIVVIPPALPLYLV